MSGDGAPDGWSDDDPDQDWGGEPDPTPGGPGHDAATATVELSASMLPGDPRAEQLLRTGEIDVLGRMPWSSNGTFLVRVDDGTDHANAIYKPERFERPLWDYPSGLWRREIAVYELARQLGWPIVPPTVERGDDAPLGVGSLQFFVPADFSEHYFTLREAPELVGTLRRMCALDLAANNCDRKGGHVLLGDDGRIWGIDHGLSFHCEFKLRTVIWDFAGEPIDADITDDLQRLLRDGLAAELAALLDPFERAATLDRVRAVITTGVFPDDPTGHRIPWPMV